MYKIMLADDEGIVIESLKFIIEKEFGNSCEIRYAKTGRSVIELAESFRPDIAIMDIQMPGINGIDAMKEIRQTNRSVIFIVVSAYDRFQYAKEAIQLGVMDYITKPMERSRIVNVLRQAFEQIDKEKKKRSNELEIKEKLETVVPVIENGLIYSILLQEHFEDDIEKYKAILGVEEKQAYMMALVCGDEQEGSHMTNAVGSGVKMQKYYKVIREMLKEYFNCIIGSVMGNKLVVLIPYQGTSLDYNERIELIEKARELVRALNKRIDSWFRLGIGSVRDFNGVGESYGEALNALLTTNGSVAHVDDLPKHRAGGEDYPAHLEKRLFAEIENGKVNDAISTARSFYEWMEQSTRGQMMELRLKVLECVLWAEHIALEKGEMTAQKLSRSDYLSEIMAIAEACELKNWLLEKIMSACQSVAGKRAEKANTVIEQAKEYIQKNFGKDISLDDVSREVDISPYYFSKIFKDSTGKNFIEYLTEVRIERAKELLVSSGCSMKEICSSVGYSDPNYFSRAFKKNVGITPTEYKERILL